MDDRRYNRVLGRLRLAATFAFIIALVYFAKPTLSMVAIGAVFAACGELIRFWAAGHLLKTKELVTSGPYRYTRNPLYLGRLLILSGLCFMCSLPFYINWIMLGVGYLVFFVYYLPRKERVEPKRLLEIHGEAYERYFNEVPALLPRLTPWPEGGSNPWSSSRLGRNKEIWMVIGLTVITTILTWRALS
jgi:protein-S-isoprenylcysteine O-methyltransferase Ste14